MARVQFTIEKDPRVLLELLPQILALADSEKEALGFLPEVALRDAVIRQRLFVVTVDHDGVHQVAGYLLNSGVFPHAKIQQIATHPNYRKLGVASALVKSLIADLERVGFMTIKAEVASDLKGPLEFYAKSGFAAVRNRAGGHARNRTIIVHVRQLDTDSLFSIAPRSTDLEIDFGIRRRSAGDAPFFAFDLNVYFDLVKDRTNSDKARKLFGAALSHHIRLAVADEFVTELRGTSIQIDADPVLQMALQLPRLPKVDRTELDAVAAQVHDLVFLKPRAKKAGSRQSLSDARHLAHAALSRASAFITRDGPILAARHTLLSTIGIDVATLDEFVALLPREPLTTSAPPVQGNGFECGALSASELSRYLADAGMPAALITEMCTDGDNEVQVLREAIREIDRIVAVGVIKIPRGMEPVARLLVHVHPDHFDCDMFADFLLDTLTRHACSEVATTIELIHLPGQSSTNSLAAARGFFRNGSSGNHMKVAFGRPLTPENWTSSVQEIRRRTGLMLPAQVPKMGATPPELSITKPAKKVVTVGAGKLEDILSPTIFIWPGRDGVIVPITRAYADDLLGTSEQTTFPFIANRDAAFLSRRAYVNTPRTAKVMRPDSPILFYESKRQGGGRGAVVAVARIVDSVVVRKSNIPNDGRRRLVVDDVELLSASEDVLLTTFDNLFVFPQPVSIKKLRDIDAIGRANLISAVSLSSEKITTILTVGWPYGKGD